MAEERDYKEFFEQKHREHLERIRLQQGRDQKWQLRHEAALIDFGRRLEPILYGYANVFMLGGRGSGTITSQPQTRVDDKIGTATWKIDSSAYKPVTLTLHFARHDDGDDVKVILGQVEIQGLDRPLQAEPDPDSIVDTLASAMPVRRPQARTLR